MYIFKFGLIINGSDLLYGEFFVLHHFDGNYLTAQNELDASNKN